MKSAKKKIRWARYLPVYLLALPGFIYLIINNYMPMFGIVIAFKDLNFRKGLLKSDWIGFKNFEYLFRSKDALLITRNTVLYNLLFIFLGVFIGILLAICLNEMRTKGWLRTYQSAILIPYLMSWVIASYLVYAILAPDVGLLNTHACIWKKGCELVHHFKTLAGNTDSGQYMEERWFFLCHLLFEHHQYQHGLL